MCLHIRPFFLICVIEHTLEYSGTPFFMSVRQLWGRKITWSMLSFLAYSFVLAPFLLPLSR